ncbi:MAG: ADP-ribosylation factor-like protein [Candidatus Hodarchaeota archaeon]
MAHERVNWLSILFVGLTGAGKTSLLLRLKTANFPTDEIIALSGEGIDVFWEGRIHLRTIDLDKPGSNWELYLPWAHAVIFIVDSSNEAAINDSARILLEIATHLPFGTILMVLANKVDLPSSKSLDELINGLRLCEIGNEEFLCVQIFQISAKTGENLVHAIDWLSNKLLDLYAERLNIFDVYVYHLDTGIKIGQALGSEQENPEAVTTLYSALNTFATEAGGYGGIKTIQVDFPGGQTRKIVKIEREKAGVLLVCRIGDPILFAREIGELILDYAESKPGLDDDVLTDDILSEIEILQHVRPFLAEEAAENLMKGGFLPEYKESGFYDEATPLIRLMQDRLSFLHRLQQDDQ